MPCGGFVRRPRPAIRRAAAVCVVERSWEWGAARGRHRHGLVGDDKKWETGRCSTTELPAAGRPGRIRTGDIRSDVVPRAFIPKWLCSEADDKIGEKNSSPCGDGCGVRTRRPFGVHHGFPPAFACENWVPDFDQGAVLEADEELSRGDMESMYSRRHSAPRTDPRSREGGSRPGAGPALPPL